MRCGDRLIEHARGQENGCGWIIQGETKPLTGFAHGSAGIAWALLKLAEVTNEKRFRKIALEALRYERSLFSPEKRNWPDLRASNRGAYVTAWCHGAAGIGLARLSTLGQLDDVTVREEIEAALMTTLSEGFGNGHSLCHGDLGNAEFLLEAAKLFGESRWMTDVASMRRRIMESIQKNGYVCGTPSAVATPGLRQALPESVLACCALRNRLECPRS